MISMLFSLCEGNSPVTGGFLSQGDTNVGFDVFFVHCLCTIFYMSVHYESFRCKVTDIHSWVVSVSSADFHISYRNVMCKISSWFEQSCGTFIDDNLSNNITLQWHRNELHGISNHGHLNSLLNRLFRCRSNKTSKLHVTGPCEGNLLVTDGFPAQRASYAENVSIWWCHHDWNRHLAWQWLYVIDTMFSAKMELSCVDVVQWYRVLKSAYLIWSTIFSLQRDSNNSCPMLVLCQCDMWQSTHKQIWFELWLCLIW